MEYIWRKLISFLCYCMLERESFLTKCKECCFAGFAFDIDFGSFATTTFSGFFCHNKQRWSPRRRLRGHVLKSLALASRVKFLASKPHVLQNCPVLGSRTALFFEPLKFCWKMQETSRKICEDVVCFPQLEIA